MAEKSPSVSPFAPAALASLPPIDGVAFATAEAGIRYKGRTDLLVAVMDEGTTAAGVLTQSKTASAPVLVCRKHLKKGAARILVVNSGNANAFTGKRGREAVEHDGRTRCRGRRLQAARGVRRLDRRHRRTAGRGEICAPARRSRQARRARRVREGRARHHDDRHLPEARHAHGADRRHRGDDQRLLQGRRHDRARHGDDAVLHFHRCGNLGRRPAGARCAACARRPSTA